MKNSIVEIIAENAVKPGAFSTVKPNSLATVRKLVRITDTHWARSFSLKARIMLFTSLKTSVHFVRYRHSARKLAVKAPEAVTVRSRSVTGKMMPR